jgi:hypothetical protein
VGARVRREGGARVRARPSHEILWLTELPYIHGFALFCDVWVDGRGCRGVIYRTHICWCADVCRTAQLQRARTLTYHEPIPARHCVACSILVGLSTHIARCDTHHGCSHGFNAHKRVCAGAACVCLCVCVLCLCVSVCVYNNVPSVHKAHAWRRYTGVHASMLAVGLAALALVAAALASRARRKLRAFCFVLLVPVAVPCMIVAFWSAPSLSVIRLFDEAVRARLLLW